MSAIKTSSNEKVPCVAIDREAISSTYNTTEFSHQNITPKMAKVVNDKNMMHLFGHKNKSQPKDISAFLSVSLPFMQKISQLSDLAKGFITWKENVYIGEGIQIAGENKELKAKAIEPLINNYIFTESCIPVVHHFQDNLPKTYQVNITNKLMVDNQPDMNLLADLTTTGKVETVPELIDNNLSESPDIHVEQNIADEDEIPLFNSMMASFPLPNIPQRVRGKANDNSVPYGENKPQLSEKNQLNMESPLANLALRSTLEPTSKELKPEVKTGKQYIRSSVKVELEPAIQRKIVGEQSKPVNIRQIDSLDTILLNTYPRKNNPAKDDSLRNPPSLLGMQLATHHLHDQQGTHQGIKENTHQGIKESTYQGIKENTHQGIKENTYQGIKENTYQGIKENIHHHVVGQLELAFTKNEPPTQPVTSLRTSYLYDNKSILLSENETNNLPDKVQETTISAQISPAEDMSPPSNMVATTANEVMRVSVPLQATQQKPEMHKMPELVEIPPFLGENQQPKTAERSFTYTFNQWQSSPSVTFELASKGEFVASTASPEVQLALNENKHLLAHETSVHIRREDERQQHRNRQQHDQQQEED
ncbi:MULTISPECIES: SpaN/EivJ family type III secretion system needle length determinant [Providencia]|uniref:SpaN/EivJ family type III secretion system needle length determinant n=1 Tax=Providencia TaxID=586 RepID=UPI0015EBDEDE|nr:MULTISPECIES: hypothetical protein [Providencia]QLQ64840.1 hypothetical protein H0904_21195 [Providencia rettgeri]URR24837.1 hypothetical protein L3Q80_10705 [Providencia rettgeri]